MIQLFSALPRVQLEQVERLADAFPLLAHQPVDIVLLDVGEAGDAGVEQLVELRQKAPHLPVVVLVNRDDEAFGLRLIHLGAQDYWVKPQLNGPEVGHWLRVTVERHRSQEVRRSQEERRRFEILFAQAPATMALLRGPEHVFELANPPYLELVGRREIIGKPVRAALPEVEGQGYFDLLDQVYASGKPFVGSELPVDLIGGPNGELERRYLNLSYMPYFEPDGAVSGVFVLAVDITEQVRLRRELEEAYAQLDALFTSTPIGLAWLDRELRFVRVNQALADMNGLAPEAHLGKSPADLLPDLQGMDQVLATLRRVLEQGEPVVGVEVAGATPATGGETRYWMETWYPIRLKDEIIGLGAVVEDKTERKRAEDRLRESEERFKYVARATTDAIWDWDLRTDQVWWNEGLESLFGYAPEEVEPDSRSWTNHIHPDDRERVLADIHRAIEQGQYWEQEYRFLRKDGSVADVLDRGFVIRDGSGQAVRMVGGMTDLTERKHYERRLQEQAALLDKAQDAIVVRDLNHRITFWNKGAERIYGWQAEEALGRNIVSLLYEDPAPFFQATRHVLEYGEWNGELEHQNRDGGRILVQARWTLVRDEAGAPTAILAINTDITAHKQLEERLLRAQRLESIGVLAGGIAHDLNNVLAPILLSTFLLKQIVQTEQGRQQVEIIEKSAQRGAQMVRQVLTFARGGDATRIRAEVGEIVREVVALMRETVDRRIQIEAEILDDVWPVEGNPTQLHQVFVNLCVNARDAMSAGGSLRIAVENLHLDEQYASMEPEAQPGPYVRVTVADTGVGIPSSIRHRIFDPFFTTKELGKGTGLGLSTALGIVRSHGGFINVYSEEGKGSVFKIYLPAKPADLAPEQQLGFGQLPQGNGELILVVDDELAVRTLTRQTLETFGYRVLLAEDGAAALALYVQHKAEIAVVLTDMMMPVMDGFATIQALLKINPNVKIIAASGLAANGMVAKAAGVGVEHFLPKPYTADAMLSMLAKVLGK